MLSVMQKQQMPLLRCQIKALLQTHVENARQATIVTPSTMLEERPRCAVAVDFREYLSKWRTIMYSRSPALTCLCNAGRTAAGSGRAEGARQW